MIHDLQSLQLSTPRADGHAQFGTITAARCRDPATMGTGNNVPGHIFTVDGNAPHLPSAIDHFPDDRPTSSRFNCEHGRLQCLQQSGRPCLLGVQLSGTNWIHPLYELPFTGGFPDNFGQAPGRLRRRRDRQAAVDSSWLGPSGVKQPASRSTTRTCPRDPDKFDGTIDAQREFRAAHHSRAAWPMRSSSTSTSGWASFEPQVHEPSAAPVRRLCRRSGTRGPATTMA